MSSSSLNYLEGIALFPGKLQEEKIPHTMTSVSTFGGPCIHRDQNTYRWSICYVVNDSGQLESDDSALDLVKIRDAGETLGQVKFFCFSDDLY